MKKSKQFYYICTAFLGVFTPTLILAQQVSIGRTDKNFSTFVYGLGGVFTTIVTLIIALSFIAFFFGLAMRLIKIGNSEKQTEAKYIMVWGIIGLLVSVSILGILQVGVATFSGLV